MKTKVFLVVLLMVALVAVSFTPAMAREGKNLNDVRLGGWDTELYGQARIDGVSFNFKGNGNFDKESSVDFFWKHKIGKLSDVSITYHNVENSGTINVPVTINNIVFAANANLTMEMSSIDVLGYRELTSGPKGYIDFMYGLKFMDFDFDANLGGVAASDSFTFPLPEIGVGGEYYFNDRWTFAGSFYGFSINRDDAGGLVKTFDTAVRYRFNPKHDSKVDKVDWYAELGWKAQYVSGHDDNATAGIRDEITVDHEGLRFGIVGKF